MQKVFPHEAFRRGSRVRRTDGRTDRHTDGPLLAITRVFLEFVLHKTNGIRLHFGKGKLGCWNSEDGGNRMKTLSDGALYDAGSLHDN